VVAPGDAELVDQAGQLGGEPGHGVVVGAAVGKVRRPAVAGLVVEDDGAAVVRQVDQGQQVVVGRARAAVHGDQRRRAGPGPGGGQVANHLIPDLVALEVGISLVDRQRHQARVGSRIWLIPRNRDITQGTPAWAWRPAVVSGRLDSAREPL